MESIGHLYNDMKKILESTSIHLFKGIVTDWPRAELYKKEAKLHGFQYDETVDKFRNVVSVKLCGEAIVGTRSMVPHLPTPVVHTFQQGAPDQAFLPITSPAPLCTCCRWSTKILSSCRDWPG